MRTITELLELKGRVHIFLANDDLCRQFLSIAEEEGFTFSDGVLPTQRKHADIYALNRDKTLNYVGYVGHVAFHCAEKVGGEPLIRVDYGKYIANESFFM